MPGKGGGRPPAAGRGQTRRPRPCCYQRTKKVSEQWLALLSTTAKQPSLGEGQGKWGGDIPSHRAKDRGGREGGRDTEKEPWPSAQKALPGWAPTADSLPCQRVTLAALRPQSHATPHATKRHAGVLVGRPGQGFTPRPPATWPWQAATVSRVRQPSGRALAKRPFRVRFRGQLGPRHRNQGLATQGQKPWHGRTELTWPGQGQEAGGGEETQSMREQSRRHGMGEALRMRTGL